MPCYSAYTIITITRNSYTMSKIIKMRYWRKIKSGSPDALETILIASHFYQTLEDTSKIKTADISEYNNAIMIHGGSVAFNLS